MDLQSLLGYAYGSPFSSSPYLDISTPQGLINMENTPIDLLGIDNLGNAKVMKAGRKNPYKFKGTQVREIPMGYHVMPDGTLMSNDQMQQGGVPPLYTRDSARYQAYLDSLYLYNRSKGSVDSVRNAPATITKPRPISDEEFREMQLFDSAEARLDRYTEGKLRPIDRVFKGNALTYEYAKPKQRVILGEPPVPRYVPQERNLPAAGVEGVDMTTMSPIQPTGRPTDVTQRPTKYSVTIRDENAPGKQRSIYFRNKEEWRNFVDSGAVNFISTSETEDTATGAGYRTMKKGGTKKKPMRGNPYQKGGYTPKQLFDFIFDDDVEDPVKNKVPVAPTTEEVDLQVAINDAEALRRQSSNMENDQMAMDVLQSEQGNPYRRQTVMGDIRSSGQFGAQNVGDYGRQIYSQLASHLGYAPEANSIYRSKEQNDALIAAGAPAAKNSWHLTGNAIDLKPTDWHRLTDEQQSFYKANYDVVYHNNHYHIEPK